MKKETNLCMSCMQPRSDSLKTLAECTHCGWIDTGVYLAAYLYPKTFLASRYIVGRLITYNGESAEYAGYDTLTDNKVTIKEYMPDALCARVKDALQITVNPGELPLYKTYLSEFIELNRSLQSLGALSGIQRVIDVFSENSTAYAVLEHTAGIKMQTYLQNLGGTMTFQQVKELFPRIFTALGRVNTAGIIHRGISPKTVFMLERPEANGKMSGLYVGDFSITAARIDGSKINSEVYAGYAAPEQYNSLNRHGDWTDVYGLAALLYNVLTGSEPQDAGARLDEDTLVEPLLLNNQIPERVSKAIMEGLALSSNERTKTIGDFSKAVFGSPKPRKDGIAETLTGLPTTAFWNTDSGEALAGVNDALANESGVISPEIDIDFDGFDDNSDESDEANPLHSRFDAELIEAVEKSLRKEEREKKRKIKMIIIISAISAIVLFFVILIIVASTTDVFKKNPQIADVTTDVSATTSGEVTSGPETSETVIRSGDSIAVPTFTGRDYTSNFEQNYRNYSFEFQWEYSDNPERPKNRIFEQDIQPGEFVTNSDKITLKISLGPERKKFPEIPEGITVRDFVKILTDLGVEESNITINGERYAPNLTEMNNAIVEGVENFAANNDIRITGFPGDAARAADVVRIVRQMPPETVVETTPEPIVTTTPPATTATPTTAATTTAATIATTVEVTPAPETTAEIITEAPPEN
ncbi:MAG: hypothetical protein FWG83_00530 [Oscillospiraceae bacterium]|nr:hypothetical protein [Oscillospiraceae bacterium]